MADSHYLIEKTSRNEHTSTDIRLLDEKDPSESLQESLAE